MNWEAPNPYSRQGEEQPFGYTGYRYDDISGTYFAQAREYQPQNGRFTAEDVIKGNGAFPETLNRYGYCWSMPLSYVDRDGKIGYYFYDPDTYGPEKTKKMVDADVALLKEYYKTDIKVIKMDTEGDPNSDSEMIEDYTFQKAWESMDRTDTIDVVVIFSHASNDAFTADTNTETNEKQRIYRTDIEELAKRNIDTLVLLGCNLGLDNKNIQNEDVIVYDYS